MICENVATDGANVYLVNYFLITYKHILTVVNYDLCLQKLKNYYNASE